MSRSRYALLVLAGLLLLGLGAPAAAPPPAASAPVAGAEATVAGASLPQGRRVTMGLIPVIPSATIFVPLDRGYFAAEGIDLQWEPVQVTSEAIAQVAAGNLNAAVATVGAAVLNGMARGVDFRIISGVHGYPPSGPGGDPFLVRKALFDSGQVRDAAALRGRKVGINGTGVFSEYAVDQVMRTADLTVADVDLQLVPFPDMPAALANAAVDAAFLPEPAAIQAVEMGVAVQILPEYMRGTQITVLMANEAFVRDRQLAEAFMRAFLRGLRDLQTEGWTSPAIAAIIERFTRVPAATVQKIIPEYADPDGRINWDSLLDQQRFYMQRGYTQYAEPLDLLRWSDDGPRQAALQALGR